MRHFKVQYHWKPSYTSDEYASADAEYDNADVIDQQIHLSKEYTMIFVSTLRRTQQTLYYLFGNVPFKQTNLLDEVRLAPFMYSRIRLPLLMWLIMGRIQWFLNIKRQPEARTDTIRRAEDFIKTIKALNGNVLIIGHGFFLRVLASKIIGMGFVGKAFDYLHNGEYHTYYFKS